MAYVSQEMKKELSVGIKKVLKKYGCKGNIGVKNHMSLYDKMGRKSKCHDFHPLLPIRNDFNPFHNTLPEADERSPPTN